MYTHAAVYIRIIIDAYVSIRLSRYICIRIYMRVYICRCIYMQIPASTKQKERPRPPGECYVTSSHILRHIIIYADTCINEAEEKTKASRRMLCHIITQTTSHHHTCRYLHQRSRRKDQGERPQPNQRVRRVRHQPPTPHAPLPAGHRTTQ